MPMNRRKMAGFGAKRLGPVFATLTLLSGCMAGIAPPSMLRMHDKVSPNSVAAQGALAGLRDRTAGRRPAHRQHEALGMHARGRPRPEPEPVHGDPKRDVAAMIYPDPTAIFAMEQFPFYRRALGERDEGLKRTRVIATRAY